MIRLLALRSPVTVLTGFDRPNLHFSVRNGSKKSQMLHDLLREQAGKSGIVYCATRSGVERVCTALNAAGFAATRYHAGLDQMIGYCRTTACLRGYILSYFGQAHEEKCGNCGNCNATFREEDLTIEAQKILSCVYRAQAHLGYPIGKILIARILEDQGYLSVSLLAEPSSLQRRAKSCLREQNFP